MSVIRQPPDLIRLANKLRSVPPGDGRLDTTEKRDAFAKRQDEATREKLKAMHRQ